jgi:4-hydroxy-tetrahydrodipicolinate reductase
LLRTCLVRRGNIDFFRFPFVSFKSFTEALFPDILLLSFYHPGILLLFGLRKSFNNRKSRWFFKCFLSLNARLRYYININEDTMKTKAIVAGAAGRMGQRIIHMLQQSDTVTLGGAFEHPNHKAIGQDAGIAAGIGEAGISIADSFANIMDKGDVLIDFTNPQSTLENIRWASSQGLSMVIGTTGITGDFFDEVTRLAKTIRCVMAPNMSVGVNVMFRLVSEMARILGNDYDMEIIEAHHRFKKDAPSGTAMRLAQVLADASGRDLGQVAVYERKGVIGERTDEEIGIQTIRAGDITGDHTVIFGGIGERLELIHRAHNRDNFARGAVRAAEWVVKQPIGLYDMQDVLGLTV